MAVASNENVVAATAAAAPGAPKQIIPYAKVFNIYEHDDIFVFTFFLTLSLYACYQDDCYLASISTLSVITFNVTTKELPKPISKNSSYNQFLFHHHYCHYHNCSNYLLIAYSNL